MKYCQKCSLEFPDAFRFCGSCGGTLSDAVRCSGCGELTEGKWTFCTSCGKPLSSDSTSDQASSPKTPEPADLPAPPSSSPTPRTPPPQTLTLPPSEQPTATGRQRSETGTPQEWYSAPDLFEETTATSPAPPIPHEENAPLEDFIEKVRLEIVARDEMVKQIVDAIVRVAHTGNHGDGKVFVWPLIQAVRIRTSETNDLAI